MQGKSIIIVIALLVLLLAGIVCGIVYFILINDSNDDGYAVIADDAVLIPTEDISEETSDEVIDFTGHPLIGTWKNTLEEIYDVDISFMETTLEFRTNGDVIRESINIRFRYEWLLEDDVLYMKSFGAWGNVHNPDNDRTYILTWITTDSFSIDYYNNNEMVVFERIS